MTRYLSALLCAPSGRVHDNQGGTAEITPFVPDNLYLDCPDEGVLYLGKN